MQTEPDRILVVAEHESGNLTSLTFELLNAGRKLADSGEGLLCACVLGHGVADLSNEITCCADEVYMLDDPLLSGFQVDLYTSALEKLCRAIRPGTLLMAHNYDNLELAPKMACRMGSEFISDCSALESDTATGHLLCTKQIYGGNVVAVLELEAKPRIITLSPKVYIAMSRGVSRGQVISFDVKLDPSLALTETQAVVEEQSVNMAAAQVIVSGGRGVKTPDELRELERLTNAFRKRYDKVELGASRPLIDSGLLPRTRQVGQTGERVSPEIYVAIAISGATQHLSGMIGSKKIIAINKDKEAPIFKVADYGVVGAFEEVLPGFVEQLEELL